MKGLLYIEVRKAVAGIRFRIAFLIAQLLSLTSLLTEYRLYLSQKRYIDAWKDVFPVRQAYTLYNVWMLNEPNSVGRTLFFFWLPILAAFPFALSYYQEEKERQVQLVIVRTSRSGYFAAKYMAVFLSGALLISITLLLNFAAASAVFPWELPLPFYPYFSVLENEMWSELFYTRPLLYVLSYIFLEGFYGGIFAGGVLVLSMFVKNQVAVMGIPMILYLGLDVLKLRMAEWLPEMFGVYEFSPYGFLGGAIFRRNGWIIAGIGAVLMALEVLCVMRQIKRYEVY